MPCDKNTRFSRILLLLVLSLLCAAAPLRAQEPHYIPITRENASEIVQLSRSGNGAVHALVFSVDASQLAVASALGVWVINLDDDASEPVLHEGQGGASSASFNPDGSLIAGGGDDGSVTVWDTQTGDIVTRLENHLYPVSAVAWSADGSLLASGDWSGVVRVWDVATWGEYRVFPTTEKIELLSFDGDMLTALSRDMEYRWSVADNTLLSQNERIPGLPSDINVSVGQRRAAWQPYYGTQSIYVFEKYEFLRVLEHFYYQVGIDLTVYGENGIDLSDYPSQYGEDIVVIPFNVCRYSSPVISPNGDIEATFGNDGIIRLLDAASGDQIAALYGHIRKINAVSFSPDSSLVVSASDDGTLQVWDASVTEDSGSLMTLEGHTSGVNCVAFNPDSMRITSTGYDGTIRMWGIPQ